MPTQKSKDFFTGCSVFVCKASDFLNISLVGLKKKLATESEMKVEWVKYIKYNIYSQKQVGWLNVLKVFSQCLSTIKKKVS